MAQPAYTIEMAHGKVWVCQRGIYKEDSILAGQPFRQLVMPFQTVEEAQAAYPEATLNLDGVRPQVYILKEPPDWFDPANAGEVWNEEDY